MKMQNLLGVIFLLLVGCAPIKPNPISWINSSYQDKDKESLALSIAVDTCSKIATIMNPFAVPNYVPLPQSSGFARGFAQGQNAGADIVAGMSAADLRRAFDKCLISRGWTPVYK